MDFSFFLLLTFYFSLLTALHSSLLMNPSHVEEPEKRPVPYGAFPHTPSSGWNRPRCRPRLEGSHSPSSTTASEWQYLSQHFHSTR